VRLPTDRDTQQRKGFGYVEFSNQASAVKAFEGLQGTELFGRSIRLDYSHPKGPDGGGSRGFRGELGDVDVVDSFNINSRR
jgi:nucleolin